ncbi:MAG: hypothetical protein JSV01_04050 [Desulfobacterales bacterium]|nr:MAG: hypothetical protein JSV01_04050 [Desulfobacterales bacterium]
MEQNDSLRVVFSEDKKFSVEFSDAFLASSVDEQMNALKALLRKRLETPVFTQDVNEAAAENEIVIVLLETFLAKLRRGERIKRDTDIGVYLEDLEMPFNTWD